MRIEFLTDFKFDENIKIFSDTFNLTILHKDDLHRNGFRSWTLSGNQQQIYWFLWRVKTEKDLKLE